LLDTLCEKAGDCLTQFSDRPDLVESARRDLAALEPSLRDVHLAILLNTESSLAHPTYLRPVLDVTAHTDGTDSEKFSDGSSAAAPSGGQSSTIVWRDASDSDAAEPLCKKARSYKSRGTPGHKMPTRDFFGATVCQWALQKLMGIGDSLAQTLRHGGESRRPFVEPKHPDLNMSLVLKGCTRWPSVVQFFWLLYHSVAEGLPEATIRMESILDSARTGTDEGSEKSLVQSTVSIPRTKTQNRTPNKQTLEPLPPRATYKKSDVRENKVGADTNQNSGRFHALCSGPTRIRTLEFARGVAIKFQPRPPCLGCN